MRRPAFPAAALALALASGPAPAQPLTAFNPSRETPEALPAGPARDVTFYVCTACHSTALIQRSGFTAEQWDGLMDWMSERQNMPVLNPALRQMIVAYLAEHFPPRRATPRGGRNPFSE